MIHRNMAENIKALVTCLLLVAPSPAKVLHQGGHALKDRDSSVSIYTIENSGALCSDVNLKPIKDLSECKESANDLKKSYSEIVFMSEEEDEGFPTGCYATAPNANGIEIHWNRHRNFNRGQAFEARPVCHAVKECKDKSLGDIQQLEHKNKCREYASRGLCRDIETYTAIYCRKSCGFCGVECNDNIQENYLSRQNEATRNCPREEGATCVTNKIDGGNVTFKCTEKNGLLVWKFVDPQDASVEPGQILTISSIGDSTYDGWYEKHIFGKYQFDSFDRRGNKIFHANIEGKDRFLYKSESNIWMVGESIGSEEGALRNIACLDTQSPDTCTNTWEYLDVENMWKVDSMLKVDIFSAAITPTTDVTPDSAKVCKTIKIRTEKYGDENSYAMGPCKSKTIPYYDDTYYDYDDYFEDCCLAPGQYTLKCKDSAGDGWHGGYVEINGVKYCDDFSYGSEKTVQIDIQFSETTYEKVTAGSLCSNEQREITSSEECKRAGDSLGLSWGGAWNGPSDFPKCLYAEDERNLVYFNRSPNPGRTDVNPKYAAICKKGNLHWVLAKGSASCTNVLNGFYWFPTGSKEECAKVCYGAGSRFFTHSPDNLCDCCHSPPVYKPLSAVSTVYKVSDPVTDAASTTVTTNETGAYNFIYVPPSQRRYPDISYYPECSRNMDCHALGTLCRGEINVFRCTVAITPTTDATPGNGCSNTISWSDVNGNSCEDYLNKGYCKNSEIIDGYRRKNSASYRFPQDNCCICGKGFGIIVTLDNCKINRYVRRGRDWAWGAQDHQNGKPANGVITACYQDEKLADVKWENGRTIHYRIGQNNEYDLYFADTSTTPASVTPSTAPNTSRPDCVCKTFLNPNGYGNCQKEYDGEIGCYVQERSSCTDTIKGTYGLYSLSQACKLKETSTTPAPVTSSTAPTTSTPDAIYEKVAAGSLCSDKRSEVTTEVECKKAAERLGLSWGAAWNGPNDFPECFLAEDARNKVYFNLSPNPKRTNVYSKYAAICYKGTSTTPAPVTSSTAPTTSTPDVCMDIDNGKVDGEGDGCKWYDANADQCGDWDDDDFRAAELCCSCKDTTYEKVTAGSLCSDERREVTSADECKRAADSLGLTWGSAWDGPNDFPRCLHAEDGRNTVFFNLSSKPGRTNVYPKYAAICKKE